MDELAERAQSWGESKVIMVVGALIAESIKDHADALRELAKAIKNQSFR